MFNVPERLQQMAARPRMWAATREAYMMQIALLLEVWGYSTDEARSVFEPCRYGSGCRGLDQPLTDDFAAKVTKIVNNLPKRPWPSQPLSPAIESPAARRMASSGCRPRWA